jgi:hypothetical protein
MTVTTRHLTRAAAVCAAAAGAVFIAVQINHPPSDTFLTDTHEWILRGTAKTVMAALALAGITGIYLRQVRQMRVLGLAGFVLFAIGYLLLFAEEVMAVVLLPALTDKAPAFANDVVVVANGGKATGDIGHLHILFDVTGVCYLLGGLLFGIALFRANILARWAAVVLAAGSVATIAIPLLPQINQRLFAIPTGVALIGLGYSLWREQRTAAARPVSSSAGTTRDPAEAR